LAASFKSGHKLAACDFLQGTALQSAIFDCLEDLNCSRCDTIAAGPVHVMGIPLICPSKILFKVLSLISTESSRGLFYL
jgi:hypothetical protein